MNRVVTTNLDGIGPGDLPPPRYEGRTRALFLTLDGMGWSTYAGELATTTAARDDVDAVHIRYRPGLGKRLFSAPLPRGRASLDSHVRRVRLARWIIRRWLAGPLERARFDVIHVTPQQYALGAVDGVPATALSVVLDATVYQAKGELGGLDRAGVERHFGPLVAAEATVFDRADQVVAFSGWAAASASTSFGVPESKLVVIPPGLHRRAGGRATGARPRGGSGLVRLVFVGSDWARKGGDRLLRWHQQYWADRAELHLVSAQAELAPSARNVVRHGAVAHDALLTELLPSMDVFVLPTRKDMSPWAVLEAAAAGMPVVSSAIGGLAELVVHGTTGYLLDPEDDRGFVAAVDRLLDDPGLRGRMGAAAEAHFAAHLDATTTNQHLLDRLVALHHGS